MSVTLTYTLSSGQSVDFVPDVVYSFKPSDKANVTSSPVLQGISVTDNVRRLPTEIALDIGMKDVSQAMDFYATVKSGMETGTVYDVTQDGTGTWINMVITDITPTDKLEPLFGRVRFSLTFKEIRKVKLSVTSKTALTGKYAKKKEMGHKDAVDTKNSTESSKLLGSKNKVAREGG
jgi:hypothetical protein